MRVFKSIFKYIKNAPAWPVGGNDYNYNYINIPIFSRQQKLEKSNCFQVRQILICSVLEINIQHL